jgi:ABC-type multidrug transport system ATPase subunit
MRIELKDVGKRFRKNTLFKKLNFEFDSGHYYAVTGPNGSGKSTLLKIIAGITLPSKGEITYFSDSREIPAEKWFECLTINAPYISLIEEFTLQEHLEFQQNFKPFYEGINIDEELEKASLINHKEQHISEFSSGMKQRLKLILAFFSKSQVILLDEPTSHLDKWGKEWYLNLLKFKFNERITVIFSNDPEEYNTFEPNVLKIK